MAVFGNAPGVNTRVATSTIANYLKTEEDNILRKRRMTAALQEHGRIKLNESGDSLVWPIRYKRAPLNKIGDVVNIQFARRNRRKVASIGWGGYEVDDAIGEMEKAINKGPQAIIKMLSKIVPDLKDDIKEGFGLELYKDGALAANAGGLYGLESIFGISSISANNYTFTNNDSYAGHSTAPGVVGSWTGTWPEGNGDDHYDWWSPPVIAAKGTAWTPSTKTWENTCLEALSYGITLAERNLTPLDLCLHSRTSYNNCKVKINERDRVQTQRDASNSLMVKLGFGSVFNWDGVDQTWEVGVESADSSALAYGLTWSAMQLHSLNSQLFMPKSDDDLASLTERFVLLFFGQLRMNPRYLMKWSNAAV